MQIVGLIISVAMLIPFIMVVVKLFKAEGTGKGILGLICGLYTFIWGWQNSGKLNIKNVMMIWTVLIVASIAVNAIGGASAAAAIQSSAAQ